MDVFYVAYYQDNEIEIEAFNNKGDLSKFVEGLKKDRTEYNVVKLQNNASLKGFIDFVSENKLSEAYHRMMQSNK